MPKEETAEETHEETVEEKEEAKTPEQLQAELTAEREKAAAAEKRAQEKEAEADRLRAEGTRRTAPNTPPPGGYAMSSFSETEWLEAESSTGLTRQQILANLNLKVQTDGRINSASAKMEARLAYRDVKDSLTAEDPLWPKYRKEAESFLADIPDEVKLADPKKWVGKAMDLGRKTVKLPAGGRKADDMDTRESGKVKEKGSADDAFLPEEQAIFAEHGKTAEDYKKLAHPVIPDGIIIRERPEAPRFGPK